LSKLPLLGPGQLETVDGAIVGISTIRVPFHDADPAGVVWHGNYFKYFDAARCVILDNLQYGYMEMAESGHLWPVVDARVKYIGAIYYDETVIVRARLVEWEYRLKFDFEITGEDGARRTTGHTVHVAVDTATREMNFSVPKLLSERIQCLLQT
jgi:acyl-CoA thioester hydrolase